MADRFKLGDTIKVTVRPKSKSGATDPERRKKYGPYVDEEEKKARLAGKQTITFHDANWRFRQAFSQEAESNVGLGPADYAAASTVPKTWTGQADWTENQFMPSFLGFIDSDISTSGINDAVLGPEGAGVTIFNKSSVFKVTEFLFDEFGSFEGINIDIYRTTDECQPLPHACAALSLTARAGSTNYALAPATSKWKKSLSAQARLDSLLARQSAGESGLETQIANAELEVAESDDLIVPMPEFSNVWSLGRRTDWTETGELRLTQRAGSVGLTSGGHFYETFDTSDMDNFKITSLPDYAEIEVSLSGAMKAAKRVRVYLVPQIWKAAITATLGAATSGDGGASGNLYALAKTMVFSRWKRYRLLGASVPISPDNSFSSNGAAVIYADDSPNPPIFVGVENYLNNEEFLTLPALGGDIESNGDLNTAEIIKWFQADSSFEKLSAELGDLISPEDGTIVLTNTTTPEGRIVACVELDGEAEQRFYVWRKTENARSEVELLNGVFRPTGSFFNSIVSEMFSSTGGYFDAAIEPSLNTGLANEDQHFNAGIRQD